MRKVFHIDFDEALFRVHHTKNNNKYLYLSQYTSRGVSFSFSLFSLFLAYYSVFNYIVKINLFSLTVFIYVVVLFILYNSHLGYQIFNVSNELFSLSLSFSPYFFFLSFYIIIDDLNIIHERNTKKKERKHTDVFIASIYEPPVMSIDIERTQ